MLHFDHGLYLTGSIGGRSVFSGRASNCKIGSLTRGRLDVIRQLAHELAIWFPQHAQSMDAALALHLRGLDIDMLSGGVVLAERLPECEITGCGSAACSPTGANEAQRA